MLKLMILAERKYDDIYGHVVDSFQFYEDHDYGGVLNEGSPGHEIRRREGLEELA